MDKNILKKFAIESRKLLEEKVADRINLYYVDEDFNEDKSGEVTTLTNEKHNLTLTSEEYGYRESLLNRIKKYDSEYGDGLSHVIEEAAFTWFNRIVCLRYMELHDFLPLTKEKESLNIRVLSSRENEAEPEIMKSSNLNNPELDIKINHEKLDKITNINDRFEYVLLKVCEKMGEVLPQIFDGETDYIELLIPKNLLNADSFLDKLIKEVPEDNFNDIEIIGWFYQYYNQSEKDKAMKEKRTYKKSEIPYVTQIFTPDWIVKYMVENSLGRLYIEKTGDESLIPEFKYFIKDNIEIDNKGIMPENITFIDPCMGSGHILIYAFEVFMKLYQNAGYNKKDIPELILKNNLYGLDIDDRAGQFAIISVMLKAREYDKDIFNKIDFDKLNILSIKETDTEYLQWTQSIREADIRETIEYLVETFKNAKEIGSLLIVEDRDYKKVEEYLDNAPDTVFNMLLRNNLKDVIRVARILSKKYDAVVTNPPYLNNSGMNNNLKNYISNNFVDFKMDIFSVFIVRNMHLSINNGYLGYMTPYVWMFISSYVKLRKYIINNTGIVGLNQLEYSALEEAIVPLCTFVIKKGLIEKDGFYVKLSDFRGGMRVQDKMYLDIIDNGKEQYIFNRNNEFFSLIPNNVFAYWLSDNMIRCFKTNNIREYGNTSKGIITGENDSFLRLWYEINYENVKFDAKKYEDAFVNKKWYKCRKGGAYRKWYGNYEYVINWKNDGEDIKKYAKRENGHCQDYNNEYKFKKTISWSSISSGKPAFRYGEGDLSESAAMFLILQNNSFYNYFLSFLNSVVAEKILKVLSPTINFTAGSILNVPLIEGNENEVKTIENVAEICIKNSKMDWDSFETSWDFKKHPLV